MARSDSFHIFPNLPKELQRMIWTQAVQQITAKTIFIDDFYQNVHYYYSANTTNDATLAAMCEKLAPILPRSPRDNPGLLHACHESRTAFLKKYSIWGWCTQRLGALYSPNKTWLGYSFVWVDYEKDVVMADWHMFLFEGTRITITCEVQETKAWMNPLFSSYGSIGGGISKVKRLKIEDKKTGETVLCYDEGVTADRYLKDWQKAEPRQLGFEST